MIVARPCCRGNVLSALGRNSASFAELGPFGVEMGETPRIAAFTPSAPGCVMSSDGHTCVNCSQVGFRDLLISMVGADNPVAIK